MSPAEVIKLHHNGVRKINVDGHAFEMDFDDAELLRQMLELTHRIAEVSEDTTRSVEERLTSLLAFADDARAVIDRAFGEGAYVKLFGDKVPIIQAMSLVTKLAQMAGPAYDAMFSEYTAN